MIIREATLLDIPQMQVIRNAVKENILSNPALVTYDDYVDFLTNRGKGWVAEMDNQIVGFSTVDLVEHNVWALFLHPDWEGKRIGKSLHHAMMDWYFRQTDKTIWLSTAFNTRAEGFYRKQGWKEVGKFGEYEIKFEMSLADWQKAGHK